MVITGSDPRVAKVVKKVIFANFVNIFFGQKKRLCHKSVWRSFLC